MRATFLSGSHDGEVILQDLLDLTGLREDVVVLLGGELRRGALAARPALAGVVVQGQGVHLRAGVLHHHLRPVVVVVGGAAGHLVQAVAAVVAGVEGVALVHVGVVVRGHVAAAAPAFVADAQVLDLPGLLAAVLGAELGHGTFLGGHVFDPLGQLLDGAGTHVAADVGLDAQHLAEVQELVGAEGVVLHGAAPVVVHELLAFRLRADAVHPVVLVAEAAARPAQHGDFQGLEGLQHVRAVTVHVRDGGILAHPDALVDALSEVLGELAVDFGRDDRLVLRRLMDGNLDLRKGGQGGGQRRDEGQSLLYHNHYQVISLNTQK